MQTRWKTSNMVQAQKKVGTHKPAMYSRTTTLILESKHDVDTSNTIIPREMHAKIPCKILKNNPKNSKEKTGKNCMSRGTFMCNVHCTAQIGYSWDSIGIEGAGVRNYSSPSDRRGTTS